MVKQRNQLKQFNYKKLLLVFIMTSMMLGCLPALMSIPGVDIFTAYAAYTYENDTMIQSLSRHELTISVPHRYLVWKSDSEAYALLPNNAEVYWGSWDGNSWNTQLLVDGVSGDYIAISNLVESPDGSLHFFHQGSHGNPTIMYMTNQTGSWKSENTGISHIKIHTADADSSGNIVLVGTGNWPTDVYTVYKSDPTWTSNLEIDYGVSRWIMPYDLDFHIDSDNIYHLFYADRDGDWSNIYYYNKQPGGVWSSHQLYSGLATKIHGMEIDSTGGIHAFADYTYYYKPKGGSWRSEALPIAWVEQAEDPHRIGRHSNCDVTIDSDDNPHLICGISDDNQHNYNIRLKGFTHYYLSDSAWEYYIHDDNDLYTYFTIDSADNGNLRAVYLTLNPSDLNERIYKHIEINRQSSACGDNYNNWKGNFGEIHYHSGTPSDLVWVEDQFATEKYRGLVLCDDISKVGTVDLQAFASDMEDNYDDDGKKAMYVDVLDPPYGDPRNLMGPINDRDESTAGVFPHPSIFPTIFDNMGTNGLLAGDTLFNFYGQFIVFRINPDETVQYFWVQDDGLTLTPISKKDVYTLSYEERKSKLQEEKLDYERRYSPAIEPPQQVASNVADLTSTIEGLISSHQADIPHITLLRLLIEIESRQAEVRENPSLAIVDPNVEEINNLIDELKQYGIDNNIDAIQSLPEDVLWTIIWREGAGVSLHGASLRPDECNVKGGQPIVASDGLTNINPTEFSDLDRLGGNPTTGHIGYSIGYSTHGNYIFTMSRGMGVVDDAKQSLYLGALEYANALTQVENVLNGDINDTSLFAMDRFRKHPNPQDPDVPDELELLKFTIGDQDPLYPEKVTINQLFHELNGRTIKAGTQIHTVGGNSKILNEDVTLSKYAIAASLYYHGPFGVMNQLNRYNSAADSETALTNLRAELDAQEYTDTHQHALFYHVSPAVLFEQIYSSSEKPWSVNAGYIGQRFGPPVPENMPELGYIGSLNLDSCNADLGAQIPVISPGNNYNVVLANARFTFTSNQQAGTLSVTYYPGSPPNPGNVIFLNGYWDITASMPNGTFSAEVTFPYTDEHVSEAGLSEQDLNVFYSDDGGQTWLEATRIGEDPVANTFTIHTDHFSLWAIGAFVATNQPPTITLLEPNGVDDSAETSFTITWSDDDQDDDAGISLYYDTDNSGEDGTLIVEGLSEDDETDQHLWNTTNIADGTYYVYAVINDGVNAPVVAYSDGPVTIVTFPPGPTPTPSQNPIPEPGTIILLIIGLICMFAVGRGILKRK